MNAETLAIYDALKRRARRGRDPLHYEDIAPLAGLNLESPGDRQRLSLILGEIGEAEHKLGRPLLTAIVVLKGKMEPGPGFYELARSCGRLGAGQDQLTFWAGECQQVFTAWSSPAARNW